MPKHYPVNKTSASLEPMDADDALPTSLEAAAAPTFWILKDATAKKLGKRSEGSISYRLLADADRQLLFIAITDNANGGYFSRERVPFEKVRDCLNSFPNKGFGSKALREAFIGRSSNNPCFLAAALSAEGLIAADATTESFHKAIGDWSAWEQGVLALPGTLLEGEASSALPDADDAMPEHTPAAAAQASPPAKARKDGKKPVQAQHAGG